jgi:hypothetical protein
MLRQNHPMRRLTQYNQKMFGGASGFGGGEAIAANEGTWLKLRWDWLLMDGELAHVALPLGANYVSQEPI